MGENVYFLKTCPNSKARDFILIKSKTQEIYIFIIYKKEGRDLKLTLTKISGRVYNVRKQILTQ